MRLEQDFKRLEEACIPDRLRAMMLLAFRGLTNQEQLNILASVGYDFVKISHALRIQYPACSGKPVHRKDYLGCGRAPGPAPPSPVRHRPRVPKGKGKGKGYALATFDETEDDLGEDVYFEDDATPRPSTRTRPLPRATSRKILARRWLRNTTWMIQSWPRLSPPSEEEGRNSHARPETASRPSASRQRGR